VPNSDDPGPEKPRRRDHGGLRPLFPGVNAEDATHDTPILSNLFDPGWKYTTRETVLDSLGTPVGLRRQP
jgi:hypothetical protein